MVNQSVFPGARDSECQWHQLGYMQICTSSQTDNHASTPALKFLQAGCPSCCPTNSVKVLKCLMPKSLCKQSVDENLLNADAINWLSANLCRVTRRITTVTVAEQTQPAFCHTTVILQQHYTITIVFHLISI